MEIFINVFKRAIKKACGVETVNEELKYFLSIYCITSSSRMGPDELLFARKIRLSFDKLRPTKKKMDERKIQIVNTTTSAKKYTLRIINLEKQRGKKEPLIKELGKNLLDKTSKMVY